MPKAEILTIGTEILLGEIQDTNTAFIAKTLKNVGIDLFRTQTIGDNSARISSLIREICERADVLIITGGLGPTVDDPTRQALADAFSLPLEYDPVCWQQIQGYFDKINRIPPENNKRQAYLPAGAQPILNPVGTAPGILLDIQQKTIACLPGVPKEMERMLQSSVIPYLQKRWELHDVIISRVLHLSGIGEAQVDELVGKYETFSNPTVGLLAKNGVIDIRVAAKAESKQKADQMISDLIKEIEPVLGHNLFGYDNDTLLDVTATKIKSLGVPCVILSSGMNDSVSKLFTSTLVNNLTIYDDGSRQDACTLSSAKLQWLVRLQNNTDPIQIDIDFLASGQEKSLNRKYAGPPENSLLWATNIMLDTIRRNIEQYS